MSMLWEGRGNTQLHFKQPCVSLTSLQKSTCKDDLCKKITKNRNIKKIAKSQKRAVEQVMLLVVQCRTPSQFHYMKLLVAASNVKENKGKSTKVWS